MKIVLSAFGDKLLSKPIEVPENTTPIFDLVLIQPITAISDYNGKDIGQHPSFPTKCRFEWTGKNVDIEHVTCRYYVLVDIEKMHKYDYTYISSNYWNQYNST